MLDLFRRLNPFNFFRGRINNAIVSEQVKYAKLVFARIIVHKNGGIVAEYGRAITAADIESLYNMNLYEFIAEDVNNSFDPDLYHPIRPETLSYILDNRSWAQHNPVLPVGNYHDIITGRSVPTIEAWYNAEYEDDESS